MKRNLIFFINPISGAGRKNSLEKKIKIHCEKYQASFEIMHTNREGDYHFLPEKIEKNGITDVVICGGDGSVGPVVSHLLKVSVNIGIIPLGSGNGLARTAGIPNSINGALKNIFTGKAKPTDAFLVNGKLGCQITGLGYDAYIAKLFSEERKRGLRTYTKLAVNNFFKVRTYPFEIEWEGGNHLKTEAFILCVSNANQFGNNLKIAPRASLEDGALDVVILRKSPKVRILSAFVNHLLFAKKSNLQHSKSEKRKIYYFNTKSITIRNPELAPAHTDGEPLVPQPIYEISILPSAYLLIQPQRRN